MLRAESTLICGMALLAPQFLLHVPLQAFFQHGLWVLAVQLAGVVLLAQPLIFCELALGQRSRYGPVKCWCFGPAWKGIGLLMLFTSAMDLLSVNVDFLEYLTQQQQQQQQQQHQGDEALLTKVPLLYVQAGLWLALLPLLVLWPKFSSKLWVLGSLVCLGGVIALAVKSLWLGHTESCLQRLWSLSVQLPNNPLDLLRTALLPFLSTAGTGIMISLGSYRSAGANPFADSVVIVTLAFLIGSVLTVSTSGLAVNYCLANSQSVGPNRTVACNLGDAACPMVALDGARNSSCDFLAYYGAESAENLIGGVNLYARLLESLPKNQVSPAAWLWCLRGVLAWLCLTYLLVRADTWIRGIGDKLQGCKALRHCPWTCRFIAALIVCPTMASLAFLMQHYRRTISIRDVYQLSTVRWLPLLLASLACLAISHGYGGVRFVKEIGGGAVMRPWFFGLVGFVTPALTIAVAGLRMHVSIAALLWPNGAGSRGGSYYFYFSNSLISQTLHIPNYANLVLAVSAFLFLLAGLFTPLIWQGACRRRRCIDLVQPTKSWHRSQQLNHQHQQSPEQQHLQQSQQLNQPHQRRSRHNSDDSSANGGDVVRDLGATTIEESPMLHTMRSQQHHQQQHQTLGYAKPVNSGHAASSAAASSAPIDYSIRHHHQQQSSDPTAGGTMSWPQRPLMATSSGPSSASIVDGGYGTVRFHGAQRPQPEQQQRPAAQYSTATLPSNSGAGNAAASGVIRFNLSEDNPTATKTLNRGILKNKHETSFRQQQQQQQPEAVPLTNHGGVRGGDRVHRGSTEIL